MQRPFLDVICSLKQRMNDELPGAEAQIRMAPHRADARERSDVSNRPCREAAVLMTLLPIDERPHVLVTVRRHDMTDHAGQVSLPGGRREPGESLLETALREAREEVDLPSEEVEVIGALTPLFIPPTNYCVYPFLAYVSRRPPLRPHAFEVDRIVEIPLSLLLDQAVVRTERWTVRGEPVVVPYFDVAGLQIWGATAMMLSELVALARDPV